MTPIADKLLTALYRWTQRMRTMNATEEPAFIPLTREEIEIVRNERAPQVGWFDGPWTPRVSMDIFGKPVHESAFAVEIRQRQLTMPITHISEDCRAPLSFEYQKDSERHFYRELHRRLTAHICTDTTELFIRLEWDCFARMKRLLRITKWFPIRYRTVSVKGTVLYPYLTVTLPHNTHHVRFALAPL